MGEDLKRIRSFLARLTLLDLGSRITAGLLRAAVIASASLCLNILFVESLPDLPWAGFAVALAGTAAFWAGLAAAAAAAVRPLSAREAGRRVELAVRDFRDDVVSSLSLAPRLSSSGEEGFSKPLLRALISDTAERIGRLRPGDFVSWGSPTVWALRLGIALLPVIFLAAAGPGISPAALKAVADPRVYWPLGQVSFQVSPGDATVARGAAVDVSAKVQGPMPGTVALIRENEGEEPVRYYMTAEERGIFRLKLEEVEEPFRYRLSSAAATSPWYLVEVVEPPTAGSFSARYSYPSYTRLPSRETAVNGNLEALKGTGVTLKFSSNKELQKGRLLLGGSEYEVSRTGERRYEATFYLGGETSYRLELIDEGGFANAVPLEYTIRYLPDTSPEVEIVSPEGEISLGPFAQVPVRFRARDDFGLSEISLVYRDPAGRETRENVLRGGSEKIVESEHLWDAGGMKAPPGSLVPVYLEASDNDSITGPKISLSNSFFVRVADPHEEHKKTEESLDDLIDRLVDLLADELDLHGRYQEQSQKTAENWENHSWEETSENESLRQKVHEAARDAGESLEALREQMSVDPFSRQEAFFQVDLMQGRFTEMMKLSLEPLRDVSQSVEPGNIRREDFLQKSRFMEKYADEAVQATEDMILMAEELRREENMTDLVNAGAEMMEMQEDLLRSLEELAAGDMKELEKVLDELAALEKMVMDLMKDLADQAQELPEDFLNSDALQGLPLDEVVEGLSEIRERLRQGDLEGAEQAARDLLKTLSDLMSRLRQGNEDFRMEAEKAVDQLRNSTMPSIERLIEKQEEVLQETLALEEATRDKDFPGAEERSLGLAAEEEELSREAARLSREARALKATLPFLDPEMEEDLAGAAADMEDAQQSLAGKAPGDAVPSEQSALAKLNNARNAASQSMRSMQQMQSLGKGKGAAFIPAWMGGGTSQSRPSRGTRSGGRMGADVRSFRIPGKEDYHVPSLFRQEILKSLQEGYPAQYERDIKDYFQRITE